MFKNDLKVEALLLEAKGAAIPSRANFNVLFNRMVMDHLKEKRQLSPIGNAIMEDMRRLRSMSVTDFGDSLSMVVEEILAVPDLLVRGAPRVISRIYTSVRELI